jgi:hypothetical protein
MNNKDDMRKLLDDPEFGIKKTQGVGGILSSLFRTILKDMNMNHAKLMTLSYSQSVKIKDKLRKEGESNMPYQVRGNLLRELSKPSMTIKTFVRGLKLLNVKRVKFYVELEFPSGKKLDSHITVDNLTDDEQDDDFE